MALIPISRYPTQKSISHSFLDIYENTLFTGSLLFFINLYRIIFIVDYRVCYTGLTRVFFTEGIIEYYKENLVDYFYTKR